MPIKKQSRSKQAFIAAFLELLKEMPIEKISVVNLSERAQYSRSAFYAQFGSQEEFLRQVVDDEIENYVAISRDCLKDEPTLRFPAASVERLFEYVYSKQELYRFLFSNYRHFNTVEYFFSRTIDPLEEFQVSFSDDLPDIDPDLYHFISSYVQKSCIKFWIEQGFKWSPHHMAEQCCLFYLKKPKMAQVAKAKKTRGGKC
ncbi:MAG: TetR/AcrR family transcriptional regulator [Clostridia bacterium]|nr:TetR/AcrR family transcriptional regulator [Clostridia bacterium]